MAYVNPRIPADTVNIKTAPLAVCDKSKGCTVAIFMSFLLDVAYRHYSRHTDKTDYLRAD